MKYEWQYSFTSKSLQFDKVTKYAATLHKGSPQSSDTIECIIEIRPDELKEKQNVASGTLVVSVPFSVKKGTAIANKLANDFSQRMAYEFGHFEINWAILVCECISETKEEDEQVGNSPYHILQISLETVPDKQIFNPKSIDGEILHDYNPILLELYNNAENKKDSIDRYLTRFKILETELVANNSREPVKKQLKKSVRLYESFMGLVVGDNMCRETFEMFVDKLVDARGKCAHLKKYKYGFLPNDPKLIELKELEKELKVLCWAFIKIA